MSEEINRPGLNRACDNILRQNTSVIGGFGILLSFHVESSCPLWKVFLQLWREFDLKFIAGTLRTRALF